MLKEKIYVGLDMGSTSVKTAVYKSYTNTTADENSGNKSVEKELIDSIYIPHKAGQLDEAFSQIKELSAKYADKEIFLTITGSGGSDLAEALHCDYLQEVLAVSLFSKTFYPKTGQIIELGGQDAKLVILSPEETGYLNITDMNMNSRCAGGTGAFLDMVAKLINIPVSELENLAQQAEKVYEISGRCGVFAVTDIQPLLNKGVSKADIVLSAFHAVARQLIAGLVKGRRFRGKTLFAGAPFNFMPSLINVFRKYLDLEEDLIILPEHPQLAAASGAALHSMEINTNKIGRIDLDYVLNREKEYRKGLAEKKGKKLRFFSSEEDKKDFFESISKPKCLSEIQSSKDSYHPKEGGFVGKNFNGEVFLGIDAGSTTCKIVFLNTDGKVIDHFYANNNGDPLQILLDALRKKFGEWKERGVDLKVISSGVTGYGQEMIQKVFQIDTAMVETMAHIRGAREYFDRVDFILDVGGQDIKAIFLEDNHVSDIVINEACSSGCGVFVENFAKSLGVEKEDVARHAFNAREIADLGSRCTVFMNSSVTAALKSGKSRDDILAGICYSIIENIFTKIVRVSDFSRLGENILLQGGTFLNDAVLRSFELYTGRKGVRPELPQHRGALGAALLARESHFKYVSNQNSQIQNSQIQEPQNSSLFPHYDDLQNLKIKKEKGERCRKCTNLCERTKIILSDGRVYYSGNRCEKGSTDNPQEDLSTGKTSGAEKELNQIHHYNQIHRYNRLIREPVKSAITGQTIAKKIGIPVVLEFWNSLPFWKTLFAQLGFDVVLSSPSSIRLFNEGLFHVPSDIVCLPGKISHGHIRDLINKGVKDIFMPMMIRQDTGGVNSYMCSIVQGYASVININEDFDSPDGEKVRFHCPTFHFTSDKFRQKQVVDFLKEEYGIPAAQISRAYKIAAVEQEKFRLSLRSEGEELLAILNKENRTGVVIAGRPYQTDLFINHDVGSYFTEKGIPVLTIDGLPLPQNKDLKTQLKSTRPENLNPFHDRMIAAAIAVAKNPHLHFVQLVSFGCGHDAFISDELKRILYEISGKPMLLLKLDEGEASGPLKLRIDSFIESISNREFPCDPTKELSDPFERKFEKSDKNRTILVPNLSASFSYGLVEVQKKRGYKLTPLPLAGEEAIELGKKYVHNDICFPGQVNIGELLHAVKNGGYDRNEIAVGLSKNCKNCRTGQYPTMMRKALDDLGYGDIPMVTSGTDRKNMHPGYFFTIPSRFKTLWSLAFTEMLEYMRRKQRPYETVKGETDALFDRYLAYIVEGMLVSKKTGIARAAEAVEAFNNQQIDYRPRPKVGIVGEILMKYHASANANLELYLESKGMEVEVLPMIDFFRKYTIVDQEKIRRGIQPMGKLSSVLSHIEENFFNDVNSKVDALLRNFRFYQTNHNVHTIVAQTEKFIDKSYSAGEGWLIPGEILEMIGLGIRHFVISQPFGCMPNHITGRGAVKAIKDLHPDALILPLDFDPDISKSNVENRLDMLIRSARAYFESSSA